MISSKYMNIIMGIFLCIAVAFTSIFIFYPKGESEPVSMEYETKVFNKNEITSIDIQMDEESFNEMLENATAEEFYKCDVVVNGTTFKNVGIRPKGNSSLTQVANNKDSNRYSFKFKFDKYVDGQTCFGLDSFVVNNMQADATYMKEYLSYDMLNYIGVKTPLYAYSNISVNGERFGLYLAVETMEDSYATRSFGTDHGLLYKPETMQMGGGAKRDNKAPNQENNIGQMQGGMKMPENMPEGMNPPEGMDLPEGMEMPEGMPNIDQSNQVGKEANNTQENQGNKESQGNTNKDAKGPMQGGMDSSGGADLKYTDDNISSYSTIFDSEVFDGTNSDYKRLIKALKNLSEGNDLEKYVNVEETLKYFAANTIMVNLDSYVSNMKHNYYLYEKDGQINILPWDLNLSFGGFQASGSSAVNFPIDTPVTGVELSQRPIIGKLLEVDTYKESYHNYIQSIISGYFVDGKFEEKVKKLDELINESVKNDPTAFYNYASYEKSIPNLIKLGTLRAESVQGQLDGTVPSTSEEQKTSADKLIDTTSLDLTTLGSQGGGERVNKNSQFKENTKETTNSKENAKIDSTEATSKESKEKIGNNKQVTNQEGKEGNNSSVKPPNNMKSNNSKAIALGSIVIMITALIFVIKFSRKKYIKSK